MSLVSARSYPAAVSGPDSGESRRQVEARVRGFAVEAARLLADLHCEQVLLYDVRGMSDLTDYVLIASGTSDRQIRSVGRHVQDLARTYGLGRFGDERDTTTRWLVLDFVEVMVHVFEPATRAHYDLEMLWGDAESVRWRS